MNDTPRPEPAADRRTDRLGLPVLPPLVALVELAALIGFFVLVDWATPDIDLTDLKPNPLWLPVLLLSLQYGTVSGLMAALFAILLTVFHGFPEEGVGENHFTYVLRIWSEPILWIAAAVLIGQFRLRQIAEGHALRQKVSELAMQRTYLADYADSLRQRCDRLERSRATEAATPTLQLLDSLAGLAQPGAGLEPAFQRCMALAFPGGRASVQVKTAAGVCVVASYGPQDATSGWKAIDALHPLFLAVAEQGATLNVIVPGDERTLAGVGLAAVPVRGGAEQKAIGMLLLETAPAACISAETTVALEMVAAAVASCLASEIAGHQPAVATVATLPLASRPRRSVRWTPGVAAAAPDEAAGHERARPRIVR